LFAEEIKHDQILYKRDNDVAVEIENGNFYWKREKKDKKSEEDGKKKKYKK
jgi:hypothetical protein